MWDFIANSTVDAIDTVPEEHQAYYVEDKATNKFVLKADIVPLATAFTNSHKSLTKANLTRREDGKKDATRRVALDGIKTVLTEVGVEIDDDADITKLPELLKTKVAELVENGKDGKSNKVNIDNVKTAMNAQNAKLKVEHASEVAGLTKAIEKLTIDSAAIAALAEAGTIETGPELLMPKVRSSVKVVKTDDGEYVARVIDSDGTYRVNSTGSEMTVKELVGDLKTKYPHMFKSTQSGGGGAKTNTGKKVVDTKGEMSSVDKIAAGLSTLGK